MVLMPDRVVVNLYKSGRSDFMMLASTLVLFLMNNMVLSLSCFPGRLLMILNEYMMDL